MSSTENTKHEIWKYNKLSRAYAKIINLLTQRKAIVLHLSQTKMKKKNGKKKYLIREVEEKWKKKKYLIRKKMMK